MSLFVVKKMNLGELTLTMLFLQMANRSLTYPQGILEDFLIKVDKFIFLVDFIMLDMEEYREVLIILRRSFLATRLTSTDVKIEN